MTNHLHPALRLAGHVLLLALGLVLLPVALPSAAPGASAMAFNPAADLDTSHVNDLRPEATDVLMLTWDNADPALWNGLLDRTEWYAETDGDAPGEGTFYVPVRTVVRVSDGAYIASYDGWLYCSSATASTMTCDNIDTAELDDAPTDAQPALTSAQRARYGTDEYGPCGTDAQCAAYAREVLHEEPTGYAT